MINLTTSIARTVANTFFEKYILGVVVSNLKDGPLSNTSGTPEELRKNLETAVNEYQSCLQNIYQYQ